MENAQITAEDLGPLLERLRQRGADLRSHPVANGTVAHTEEAGELLNDAAAEIERLLACESALRDLDARLKDCIALGLSASEAYDSGYQEATADALVAARKDNDGTA